MKKTFQKTLVAAAMGVAMLSAAGTASANSLLFPYFSTASTGVSVVSLSLTNTSATIPSTEALHYVYNYGSSCIHYDASGSITNNDLLSHGILQKSINGVDSAKVITTDKSTGVTFPLVNETGFLIVSTRTSSTVGLRGSMAIIDPAQNLAISYPAIDNMADTSVLTGNTAEGDFSLVTDKNFALSALSPQLVTTSWFVNVVGNMNAAIAAGANWTGATTFTNNGNVYDNDEVAYSGTVPKSITCQGKLNPADLMTGAQQAALGFAPGTTGNGGLVRASASAVAPVSGVVLLKTQLLLAPTGTGFSGRQVMHREATAF